MSFLKYKSYMCEHEGSCASNQLRRTGNTIIICWGIRIIFKAMSYGSQIVKNPVRLLQVLLKFAATKDSLNLACILGSLSFIKGIVCLQKKYWVQTLDPNSNGRVDPTTIESKIDYFMPSFVCGIMGYYFVDTGYRNLLALYAFSRCVDIIWTSYKKKKGWNNTNSSEYAITYILMTSLITAAFIFEPNLMPESLRKLYIKFSSLYPQESIQKMVYGYKFSVNNFA